MTYLIEALGQIGDTIDIAPVKRLGKSRSRDIFVGKGSRIAVVDRIGANLSKNGGRRKHTRQNSGRDLSLARSYHMP